MKQELRIIVTQACNYNCYFCHHEGLYQMKKTMLSLEDISYLYEVANRHLDMTRMTLTGGEPFILKDIVEIVKRLDELGCELTVVTNGSYLEEKIEACKYIKKLNISIHSLNKDEYENIVGKKETFENVIKNIKLVRKTYPNLEINLNFAFINCENIYEKVTDLIEFAKENKLNIKFIELFPKTSKDFIAIENLQAFLLNNGHKILEMNDRKTKFTNTKGRYIYTTKCFCSRSMDFESAGEFCNKNNDVFVTPDGNAKVCRMKKDEIELLEDIKNKNEEELAKKLKESFAALGEGCPFEKNMVL